MAAKRKTRTKARLNSLICCGTMPARFGGGWGVTLSSYDGMDDLYPAKRATAVAIVNAMRKLAFARPGGFPKDVLEDMI